MVYFVQAKTGGPIKIGYTGGDVAARLTNLQNATWEELEVTASFPGDREDERALHRMFGSLRIRGEWFTPAPPLAEIAEGIGDERLADVPHAREAADQVAHAVAVAEERFCAR